MCSGEIFFLTPLVYAVGLPPSVEEWRYHFLGRREATLRVVLPAASQIYVGHDFINHFYQL